MHLILLCVRSMMGCMSLAWHRSSDCLHNDDGRHTAQHKHILCCMPYLFFTPISIWQWQCCNVCGIQPNATYLYRVCPGINIDQHSNLSPDLICGALLSLHIYPISILIQLNDICRLITIQIIKIWIAKIRERNKTTHSRHWSSEINVNMNSAQQLRAD